MGGCPKGGGGQRDDGGRRVGWREVGGRRHPPPPTSHAATRYSVSDQLSWRQDGVSECVCAHESGRAGPVQHHAVRITLPCEKNKQVTVVLIKGEVITGYFISLYWIFMQNLIVIIHQLAKTSARIW